MELDLNQEPQGIFVRDKQGHFYFLPTAETKQLAVHADDEEMVSRLWHAGEGKRALLPDVTVRTVAVSCAYLKNYLDTRFIDDHWRPRQPDLGGPVPLIDCGVTWPICRWVWERISMAPSHSLLKKPADLPRPIG